MIPRRLPRDIAAQGVRLLSVALVEGHATPPAAAPGSAAAHRVLSVPAGTRAPAPRPRVAAPATPRRRRASSSAAPASLADRKSTRLNSSHLGISYAVFCLKKKKNKKNTKKNISTTTNKKHIETD